MSESVFVTAAVAVPEARLRAYLRAPVTPAATWSPQRWAGLAGAASGELAAAIRECDRWIDGDYAGVFRALEDDGELTFRFDETTGSLAVDFAARADFRLPTLVWAVTVLRGLADFLADGDHGLVTVTNEWSDDTVLLHLTPGRSAFLDRDRDARAYAEARSREIDIQAAAGDAGEDEAPGEVIDRLL